MKKINLRELYPDAYTTDFFVNVTEDVLETIRASERAEAAYERKMYRYKAQYSLDCENGIENTVLTKPQTPEMVLEEKQLQKQVYFRHSCTFCTPHFFYIARKRKKVDFPAPWPPTRQSSSSYLEPGWNTLRIAPSRKCLSISST